MSINILAKFAFSEFRTISKADFFSFWEKISLLIYNKERGICPVKFYWTNRNFLNRLNQVYLDNETLSVHSDKFHELVSLIVIPE